MHFYPSRKIRLGNIHCKPFIHEGQIFYPSRISCHQPILPNNSICWLFSWVRTPSEHFYRKFHSKQTLHTSIFTFGIVFHSQTTLESFTITIPFFPSSYVKSTRVVPEDSHAILNIAPHLILFQRYSHKDAICISFERGKLTWNINVHSWKYFLNWLVNLLLRCWLADHIQKHLWNADWRL